MPDIDVSELLVDPDFVDNFQISRTQSAVGNDGRAHQSAAVVFDVEGVVVPKGTKLVQIEEGQRLESVIEVYVAFQLTAGQDTVSPDIIKWGMRSFRVVAVEDWSRYGEGFVKATCFELSFGNRTGVSVA